MNSFYKPDYEEYELFTYLWTWDSPDASQLVNEYKFTRAHLAKEPDDGTVLALLSTMSDPRRMINTYKQYYSMKQAIEFVGDECDFIVYVRTDGAVQFGNSRLPAWISHLKHWLNEGYYTTSHSYRESAFTSDQLAVAPYHLMHEAWDYKDADNLLKLMRNITFAPEQVLDQMLEASKMPIKLGPPIYYILNR